MFIRSILQLILKILTTLGSVKTDIRIKRELCTHTHSHTQWTSLDPHEKTQSHVETKILLSNSYTMCCPPVRGDNPRALASGLSYVQVDKHGITILYHLH